MITARSRVITGRLLALASNAFEGAEVFGRAHRFGESMASNVINIRTGPANAPIGQATTLHADALTLEFQRPDTPVRSHCAPHLAPHHCCSQVPQKGT